LGTEEKRGTMFKSSTDKIFESFSLNNKIKKKRINFWGKNWSTEYTKGNKTVPGKVATTRTEDGHK
jgi:hypothetical protein